MARIMLRLNLIGLLIGVSLLCDAHCHEFCYWRSVAPWECITHLAHNNDLKNCASYPGAAFQGMKCETDSAVGFIDNCPGGFDIFMTECIYRPGICSKTFARPSPIGISCGAVIMGDTSKQPQTADDPLCHIFPVRPTETATYTFDFCNTPTSFDPTVRIIDHLNNVETFEDDDRVQCTGKNVWAPHVSYEMIGGEFYTLKICPYGNNPGGEYNLHVTCDSSVMQFMETTSKLLTAMADVPNMAHYDEKTRYTENIEGFQPFHGADRHLHQTELMDIGAELSHVMYECIADGHCDTLSKSAGFIAMAKLVINQIESNHPELVDTHLFETAKEVVEKGAAAFSVGEYALTWNAAVQAASFNPFAVVSTAWSGSNVGKACIDLLRAANPNLGSDEVTEEIENSVFIKVGGGTLLGNVGGAIIGGMLGAVGGPAGIEVGVLLGSNFGGLVGSMIGAIAVG